MRYVIYLVVSCVCRFFGCKKKKKKDEKSISLDLYYQMKRKYTSDYKFNV